MRTLRTLLAITCALLTACSDGTSSSPAASAEPAADVTSRSDADSASDDTGTPADADAGANDSEAPPPPQDTGEGPTSLCPPAEAPAIGNAEPGQSFVTYVPSEQGNVAIQVRVPTKARYLDHASVVVNVATFFTTTAPFYTDLDVTPLGLIHVSYLWPGTSEPKTGACSDGTFEHGGPNDIAALRDVVRYALGDLKDIEGKNISDRIQGMTPGAVGLWAFSHPGIAAVNVLANHADELANVRWYVARENPTQDQHSAVELGHFGEKGERILNPLYDYATHYEPGLLALDYSSARWAPDYQDTGDAVGRAYFDLDGDGLDQDSDHILSFRVPTMWGKRYLSRALTHALRDNGLSAADWPADLATPEEADSAWAYRNSVDRFASLNGSDLKVMLVFAERQHVQPLPDAASVHSAYDGFHAADLWIRINPDRAYAEWATDQSYPDFPDHDAEKQPLDWSKAGENWGYPTAPGKLASPLGSTIGWAAVAEMSDREELDRWEPNLDAVLIPQAPSPQPKSPPNP